MILKVILASIVLVGLAFAAIAVKMFLKKDGKFTKSCSAVDASGEKIGCVCGSDDGSACVNKKDHHH